MERLPPLCTQLSLTHCPPKPGLGTEVCSGRHADPRAQCTQHMQMGTHAHKHPAHLRTQMCTTYQTQTHTPCCPHRSTRATHSHMHTWLHMVLTRYRQKCIDFPASPVTARWWDSPRGLPFNALINFLKGLYTQSLGLFQMSQAWPNSKPRKEADLRGKDCGAGEGEGLPLPGRACILT